MGSTMFMVRIKLTNFIKHVHIRENVIPLEH